MDMDARLTRIEEKQDKMLEAFAKLNERAHIGAVRTDKLERSVEAHGKRLDSMWAVGKAAAGLWAAVIAGVTAWAAVIAARK